MKRSAPGSDLLKVTRRAVCMLQSSEATSPVPIIQNAELEEASRFAFESPLRIAKAASEMSSGSAKLAWSEREKLDFADLGA